MAQLKLGTCSLGKVPRVVAIIDEPLALRRVERISDAGADILEMRVDCLSLGLDGVAGYIEKVGKITRLPLLCTIKETRENSARRLEMYERLIPLVDAVDIDIDASIAAQVVKMTGRKIALISWHDYKKTPKASELASIVDRACDMGADIVKIATMATRPKDVTRLMRFTESRTENLVTLAMGSIGTISRVMAPLFGSLFTYAYTTKAVAPGQLSLESLVEEMRLFYPSFDEKFDSFA